MHDEHGVYLYIICMYLNKAGFKVIVKISWRELKYFHPSSDLKLYLLKQNHIFVSNCDTPLNTIVLIRPNIPNHIIRLSYGYNVIHSGQFDCIANYPMHPFIYKYFLTPTSLPDLKKSDRTIKIFFAGGTHKVRYADVKVKKFFNVIPRLEVIKFILENFDDCIRLQKDSDKLILNRLLNSSEYINKVIISEVKTEEDNWLKMLSKTDFFICPPGAKIPFCHNSVEAMSMGAIPILEYGNLFSPHLENFKNCLSYTNYEELKMAIEKALTMQQSEIENMRKNVLSYYNNYLSLNSIAKKIKTFSESPKQELKVAIPFIASKEEWAEYKKAYKHLFT